MTGHLEHRNTMCTLSDEQKESLRLFRQRSQEIRNHRVVTEWKETLRSKISVECGQTTTEIDGYDLDVFRSFWTILRQFVLSDNEKIFFNKVCNIIWTNCSRNELKKWVEYKRDNWQSLLKATPFVSFANEEKMATNKTLLKLWVNGVVFHTDTEGYDYWNALPVPIQNDAMLSIQGLTLQLIGCILTIDAVIHHWLDEPNAAVPPLPTAP